MASRPPCDAAENRSGVGMVAIREKACREGRLKSQRFQVELPRVVVTLGGSLHRERNFPKISFQTIVPWLRSSSFHFTYAMPAIALISHRQYSKTAHLFNHKSKPQCTDEKNAA